MCVTELFSIDLFIIRSGQLYNNLLYIYIYIYTVPSKTLKQNLQSMLCQELNYYIT